VQNMRGEWGPGSDDAKWPQIPIFSGDPAWVKKPNKAATLLVRLSSGPFLAKGQSTFLPGRA
jgi:hypothetical protein